MNEDRPILLELFAGTRSIGKAFEKKGWDVVSVDLDETLEDVVVADAYQYLKEFGSQFDAVWASPMCTSYSVAGLRYHRAFDPEAKKCIAPASDLARQSDELNAGMMADIRTILAAPRPPIVLIENPRGQLRNMPFMKACSDILMRDTVTYCSYGDPRYKATDIWHTCPLLLRPPALETDHVHAPTRTRMEDGTVVYGGHEATHGMRERSVIPEALCDDIAGQVDGYWRTCVRDSDD